jgi:hypothetical protein
MKYNNETAQLGYGVFFYSCNESAVIFKHDN